MELRFHKQPVTAPVVPQVVTEPSVVEADVALSSDTNTREQRSIFYKSRVTSAIGKVLKCDIAPEVKLALRQINGRIVRERDDLIEGDKIAEMIAKKVDSFRIVSHQMEFASWMLHLLTRASSLPVAMRTLEHAQTQSKWWPEIKLLDETTNSGSIDQPLQNKLLAKLASGESLSAFEVFTCRLLDVTEKESTLLDTLFKQTKREGLTSRVMFGSLLAFLGTATFGTYTGLYQLPYELVIGGTFGTCMLAMGSLWYNTFKVNKLAKDLDLFQQDTKNIDDTPAGVRRATFRSSSRHLRRILYLAQESGHDDPQLIADAQKSLSFVSLCQDIAAGRKLGLQGFNSLLQKLGDSKEELIAFNEIDTHIIDEKTATGIQELLSDLHTSVQFAEASYTYREYLGLDHMRLSTINLDLENVAELLEVLKSRSRKLRSAEALDQALGDL